MSLKRISGRVYALLALGLFLHFSSALPQFSLHAQQLTITPSTVPNGAIGAGYGQALIAIGGIPPFHFSISSGALPAGLNIGATSGTIGGVPSGPTGTSSFTVQVTDSSTPALTGSANFSITISAADTSNDGELNGHYALLFSGFNDSNNTLTVVAASFTADGQGNITNGIEDADGVSGAQPTQTLAGTYTLGANNLGTMTLTTPSGTTVIAFSAGGVKAGVVTKARFIRFDDVSGSNGHTGSGVILKQDISAFALSGISGPYAFGESGSNTSNGNAQSGVGFVTADGNGNFTPAGLIDLNDAGTLVSSAAISGTYAMGTESASNGRFTASLTIAGVPGTASDILYVISANQVVFISINTTQNTIYSGIAQLQVPPAGFGLGSLNGNSVFSGQGKRSDGTSSVIIGAASFDGNGNFTMSFGQIKSGTFTTGDTASGTYTADSNGRSVLTFTSSSVGAITPVVLYLDATNQGFLGATDNAASQGVLEQGGSGFNNATLFGPYFFGTVNPKNLQQPNTVGVASFDGVGTVQSTAEDSGSGGILLGDSVNSQSYSVASNGQLTFTDQGVASVVGYVASECKIEVFSTFNTFPGIETAECQGTQAVGTVNVDLLNNGSSGVGTVTDSTGQINCTTTGGELQSGSCSATYAVGMNVTFTEQPGAGSVFTGWQDSCASSGTAPTCTITVGSFGTVLANFGNGPGTFTLNVTPGTGETGGGQVSSQIGAAGTINCTLNGSSATNVCSATVKNGSAFVLSEVANGTSTFTGWSGACTGTGSCIVTMNQNQTVSPTFTATSFALTVVEGGTGTGMVMSTPAGVTCPTTCSANFTSGSQVMLTETPTNGSTFTGWGGACSGTGACMVTMSASESVTATFSTSVSTFTLSVTPASGATGDGNVSGGSGAINCHLSGTSTPTGTCSANFASGAAITLTETENSGSTFSGWTGTPTSCTVSGSTCTFSMPASAETVTANFTLSGSGGGVASVTPSSFAFGAVQVGSSATQTFSFSNTGTGPLGSIVISIPSVASFGSLDYAITNNTCPASLPANSAPCSFTVSFTPRFEAPDPGSVVITDDSSAGATTVLLTGSGAAPIYVLPFEIFWDAQTPGTTSTPQTATLFNTTDSGVSVTGVTFVGNAASDFSVASNNCGDGANPSCSISIEFTPSTTVLGPRTADLSIATNATAGPLVSHLTGNGAIRHLPGFNANVLPPNDDKSTNEISLPFTLNFFGTNFSSLFVNNNGNVTFGQALTEFTPTGLNSNNGGIPIIAPFWADVDTSGAFSGDPTVPGSPPSGIVTFGVDTVNGHPAFGVNYENVGYFLSHTDKLNSFQLILIDRSDTGIAGAFDIEFNYDKIQWEAGDVSGGTDGLCTAADECAAVGYSNGSGAAGTNFQLNGSFTIGALLDNGPAATSLIHNGLGSTMIGRYEFQVRNGVVQPTLTVTETGTGTGTVTSAPAGVNCPTTCSANFASGTQITLTATPADGSTFAGWSGGGCTGTGTCVVTITATTTVTATFNTTTNKFALMVAEAGTGTGTVMSSPAGIHCPTTCSANFGSGTQVTLTASAADGSTFAGWTGAGCTGMGTCVVTVTVITSVTATFNSSSPVTIGIGQGSSSTVTTTPGSSAVFGLVLTALPGTIGTVQLTCSSPIQSITCNIVPSSVTLTGKAFNVAIVVDTFCKGFVPNFGPMPGGFGTGLGLLLATLALCGAAWTYKKQPRWALSFGFLIIFAVGMSACSSVAKSPSGTATPPGSYPLVVTATAPNGATSSVKLTLVVK